MSIRVSVTRASDGRVFQYDAHPMMSVSTLKTMMSVEVGIPPNKQVIKLGGVALNNDSKLGACGVQAGSVLEVSTAAAGQPQAARPTGPATPAATPAAMPGLQGLLASLQGFGAPLPDRPPTLNTLPKEIFQNATMFKEFFIAHPDLLTELTQVNPRLAQAVLNDDPRQLDEYLRRLRETEQQRREEESKRLALMHADPFDPEAQAAIAEQIREVNVHQNYEHAVEYNPESFGRVVMLYVPCTVNGHDMTAFVDSGAQSTIMSQECAERCGIMRLLDRRFAGTAVGVGTAKIVGRVHAAPLKLGNTVFSCSFTILDNPDMEFLFGLDQLKRHLACIDLKENCLRIGDEAIPFLAEKDLPLRVRESAALRRGDSKESVRGQGAAGASSSAPVSSSRPTASSGGTVPSSSARPNTQPAPIPVQPRVNEEQVSQLMALGFSRSDVVQALQVCNGDAERAAALLFSG